MTGTTLAPRDAQGLARHPHRITLWGTVAELAFPPLCANCAQRATRRIVMRKTTMHVGGEDVANSWVDVSPLVPFCDACIARHCAEIGCRGVEYEVRSTNTPGGTALGFAFAAALAGWTALRELLHLQLSGFLGIGLFAAGLALIAWRLWRRAWRVAEYIQATKQSSVTEAFDFVEPEPGRYEAQRTICALRNDTFAADFRSLNGWLEFDPVHPVPPKGLRPAGTVG